MNEQLPLVTTPDSLALHPRHQGELAERRAINTLKAHPYWRTLVQRVVPWSDYARQKGLPTKDIGIDLVAITNDNDGYAVQVKARKDQDALDWKELATFYGCYRAHSEHFAGAILITNAALTLTAEQQLQAAQVVVVPPRRRASCSPCVRRNARALWR